jgi:hypothetical protein
MQKMAAWRNKNINNQLVTDEMHIRTDALTGVLVKWAAVEFLYTPLD